MAIKTSLWFEHDFDRTGSRDLDAVNLGTIRMVPGKVTSNDWDGHRRLLHVRVSADMARSQDSRAIRQALREKFSGGRCHHAHDCCGCWFHQAYARRISRRDFVVTVSSYRNV